MNNVRIPGGYRVVMAGAEPDEADGAVIMVHGRGDSALGILSLAESLGQDNLRYVAPEPPGGQWYPFRFLEPMHRNEPGITLGMQAIDGVRAMLEQHGIGPERTVLLGFSQGACLALEYVARHARRFGGVAGLSGALIGPDGTPRDYAGSLDGTPVFLGCSDVDFHIPVHRVHEAAEVLDRLGGLVAMRIYPGMGHTINDDEIAHVRRILSALPAKST